MNKCLNIECNESIDINEARKNYGEGGSVVFHCPHCGAENFALIDTEASTGGPLNYVFVRVRTENKDTILGQCPNKDCTNHGFGALSFFETQPGVSLQNFMTGAIECPECGTRRLTFEAA